MSFFKRLDTLISSFIWNNKILCLSRAYLQRPKVLGMALPDFQLYYCAANIRSIVHWLYEDPGADAPSWCTLEARSCAPSTLSALVYAPLASDTALYSRNILAEVGVSRIHASHKQVSSLNLQASSKSKVTLIKIKQVKSSHG